MKSDKLDADNGQNVQKMKIQKEKIVDNVNGGGDFGD